MNQSLKFLLRRKILNNQTKLRCFIFATLHFSNFKILLHIIITQRSWMFYQELKISESEMLSNIIF
jgi:hypothetical protein